MLDAIIRAIVIGVGATAILDLWIAAGSRFFGIAGPNWAMVGRWVGHMPSGTFTHTNIGQARPVRGELALGWFVHYATGVFYGLLLVALWGIQWLQQPALLPPLILLWVFLIAPYFVMTPAMGGGIAAAKTKHPNVERVKSIVGHSVFGLGMYLTAVGLNLL